MAGTEIFVLSIVFIATIIGLGLVLPIGQQLIVSTGNSVTPDSTWTAAENATLTTVGTNVQTGMSLFANAPLLAAAGGIIGLIFVAFGFIMKGGGGI